MSITSVRTRYIWKCCRLQISPKLMVFH